eukprot:15448960-Alexandrium_andersonii.AAC.1
MSASLVGSEMCIRDRCKREPSLASGRIDWDLHIAKCPKCNPQSAQGPPLLKSASIGNPPCGICNIAQALGA